MQEERISRFGILHEQPHVLELFVPERMSAHIIKRKEEQMTNDVLLCWEYPAWLI